MLQFDSREQFIQRAAIKQERPPYFTLMEEKNLEGAAFLSTMTVPPALEPGEFAEIAEAADVLDTRSVAAFGAAHIHSAISMWPGGVSSFAGWFLQPRKPLLIVHGEDDISPISLQLYRMGFDSIAGYLAGGILGWHRSGRNSEATRTVTVQDLCSSLDENEPAWILDVRSEEELEQEGTIPNAHHLHLTQLPQHMDSIPRTSPVYVFCGSGLRSMIVASLLQRNGWSNLSVVMGGVAGWNAVSCPLGREQREEEVLAGG
jgi:hydroxyacylglutathione hydrolase